MGVSRRYCLCLIIVANFVLIITMTSLYLNKQHYALEDSTGYVLVLNSSDQSTGGGVNLLSLQCLMKQIDPGRVVVVEPFTVRGVLGAHLSGDQQELARENNVRLSDIYDIMKWEKLTSNHGYASLARWEDFLLHAPRDLILADFRFRSECLTPQLLQKLNLFAKLYNFRIVQTVCFNFAESGPLNLDQFKELLYGTYAPTSVSVIFSTFGGVSDTFDNYANRCILKPKECGRSRIESMHYVFTEPSQRLLIDAERYTNKYLNRQTDYLSIMIRLEQVLVNFWVKNKEGTAKACITNFTKAVEKIQSLSLANGIFFAMDIGKYGSIDFINGKRGNTTFFEELMRDFFQSLFSQTLTFSEWEESFQNISGLTSGGVGPYVAGLQKVLASRGRCILVAGGGSFQESALNLYKKSRKENQHCYITLDRQCNQAKVVLP